MQPELARPEGDTLGPWTLTFEDILESEKDSGPSSGLSAADRVTQERSDRISRDHMFGPPSLGFRWTTCLGRKDRRDHKGERKLRPVNVAEAIQVRQRL